MLALMALTSLALLTTPAHSWGLEGHQEIGDKTIESLHNPQYYSILFAMVVNFSVVIFSSKVKVMICVLQRLTPVKISLFTVATVDCWTIQNIFIVYSNFIECLLVTDRVKFDKVL